MRFVRHVRVHPEQLSQYIVVSRELLYHNTPFSHGSVLALDEELTSYVYGCWFLSKCKILHVMYPPPRWTQLRDCVGSRASLFSSINTYLTALRAAATSVRPQQTQIITGMLQQHCNITAISQKYYNVAAIL